MAMHTHPSEHHDDGQEVRDPDGHGLSRRALLRRAGLATGGMLLASGVAGFAPVPAGSLRGPQGAAGASRASRLSNSAGTRLVHADMHNHTLLSDGDGNPANAFGLMRARGLDVAALTDHTTGAAALPGDGDSCGDEPSNPLYDAHSCGRVISMNQAGWKHAGELADAANDPRKGFIAVRGFEWSAPLQGHMNVWFTEEMTDPTLTGGQVALEGLPGLLGDAVGANPVSDALLPVMRRSPALGMEGMYQWLQSAPGRPVLGGGLDGIAGFNHPGREPGRFGQFGHLSGVHDRVVSIEVMNRDDDYLFQGLEYGDTSPIQQALDAGWRLGLLGVTDEHGEDAWGRDVNGTRKGRAGLWIREDLPYDRMALKEAMVARRFFATNKSGLRLDLQATSMTTTESVRMGQTLAHEQGTVVVDLDLDGINGGAWAGSKQLHLQVLRSSTGVLPEVAFEMPFTVPNPSEPPLRFSLYHAVVDHGDWIIVRISDPSATDFGGERGSLDSVAEAQRFKPWGRAVAYASPIFLAPDADASAEAMRREQVAGLR